MMHSSFSFLESVSEQQLTNNECYKKSRALFEVEVEIERV